MGFIRWVWKSTIGALLEKLLELNCINNELDTNDKAQSNEKERNDYKISIIKDEIDRREKK